MLRIKSIGWKVRTLFICLFTIVLIGASFFATKDKKLIEFLPSWGWISFAVIPFYNLRQNFHHTDSNIQLTGILIAFIFIFLSDFSSYFFNRKKKWSICTNDSMKTSQNSKWEIILFIITILIPIAHMLLLGNPLMQVIFSNGNRVELRDSFTKINSFPNFINYIPNYIIAIFGPLFIKRLFVRKKYSLSILILGWIIFYSISSTAKSPLFEFIICLIVVTSSIKFRIHFLIITLITTSLLFSIYSAVDSSNQFNSHKLVLVDEKFPVNKADLYRRNAEIASSRIHYLEYRIYLVPMEVSNRWYAYWEKNNKRNFINVFTGTERPKASNIVGNWAYTERFPDEYGPTINANASIDADSFSIGGLESVIYIMLIYLITRIFLGLMYFKFNHKFRDFYYIALALLFFLPFQSSFQSIFIAHGLFIIIFLGLTQGIQFDISKFKRVP